MAQVKTAQRKTASAAQPAKQPAAHGVFCWNELMTRDVERAKKFYAKTLGWTFEPMPMEGGGTYWIVKMGEARAGGIFDMGGAHFEGMPDQWVSYIAVDDVDARVKKAVAGGAKTMRPAFDVPNVGRIAFLHDPGGAVMAWMTPSS